MQLFTALLSAFALAASTTTANPTGPPQNASVSASLTYPVGGEKWQISSQQTVMWDYVVSDPNADPNGYTVDVHLANNVTGHENIINPPLAQGIPLPNKMATITTPNVTPGDKYLAVLIVDNSMYSIKAWNSTVYFSISA